MPLPETSPSPAPILGYAGAEAIQLDPLALARIRLGTGFLIAYMASSLLTMFFPILSFPLIRFIFSLCTGLCLATGACLLASNTRLPSDRPAYRRLLFAAAIALVVTSTAYFAALYLVFGNSTSPKSTYYWLLSAVAPFNTIAHGLVLGLSLLRLSTLARRFNAPSISLQCLAAAIIFLALYLFYFLYPGIEFFIGLNAFRSLSLILSYFRIPLSLWSATFLAFLLPRLKPTSA